MNERRRAFLVQALAFLSLVTLCHIAVTLLLVEPAVLALRNVRERGADILLLGDSVLQWPDRGVEGSRPSIERMVTSLTAPCRTAVLAGPAFHMELYDAAGAYISRNPRRTRPRVVVVPINLRSFTTSWTMRPGWQFGALRRALLRDSLAYDLMQRPLSGFKWYEGDEGSMDAYLKAPVFYGTTKIGTVGEYSSSDKPRTGAILHYMEAVNSESPRFRAMVQLARRLKDAGIKRLFYLTPIDWQLCRQSLGQAGLRQIEDNVSAVVAGLAAEGVRTEDWTTKLNSAAFDHGVYPDEHLATAGREWLATALAESIDRELAASGGCGPER